MKKSKTEESPSRLKVLFADDEPGLQDTMSMELPRMGCSVTVCPDGLTAIAAMERNSYDCVIADLDMPGASGIEVITQAKELSPGAETVVLTGKSSLKTAVEALRQGAFDYLTKPCKLAELRALLGRVAEKRKMTMQIQALTNQLERVEGGQNLVGDGPKMAAVKTLIGKVAPTTSNVLILGETGTGKELVARAVHEQSARADQPFVAINCGALPENLIESELFGHRKGAFTGADEQRTGLFEVADGGTIFLDEIGELPLSLQAKLLRVLESREIRRVGDNEPFSIDVRIVCATHRNLGDMVEEASFREDLMYRINTFSIHLPALRERLEDVPELARHLYGRFRNDTSPGDEVFTTTAIDMLKSHTWPGNIRELANVIEHATILCDHPPIAPEHLPQRFNARGARGASRLNTGPMSLRDLELQAIQEALERHDGNKPAAAKELGVSVKTLYNKLNAAAELNKAA